MLQYRHRKFGHVADVPEPADILAAADAEAKAIAATGTKRAKRDAEAIGEYAIWQANRQRQTLARMDESRKWERYTPPVAVSLKVQPESESRVPDLAEPPAKRAPSKVVRPEQVEA